MIVEWVYVKQMTRARNMVHQPSKHGWLGKVGMYAKMVGTTSHIDVANCNGTSDYHMIMLTLCTLAKGGEAIVSFIGRYGKWSIYTKIGDNYICHSHDHAVDFVAMIYIHWFIVHIC